MPKVSDEHKAARRNAIIDAALAVLLRRGYAKTSMADIIRESGLSAGAIYSYFNSKQEIVRAVAEQVLGRRTEAVQTLSADRVPSPSEVVSAVLRGLTAEPFAAVIVQLWGEAITDPELRMSLQQVFEQQRDTLTGVILAWGKAHPEKLPSDYEQWAPRVSIVLASLGPGFMLFSTLMEGFDPETFLTSIHVALGLEPQSD